MNMAKDPRDSFLQAEEEAHCLVEVLKQLKHEVESYKTAHEALDQAAMGISELTTRCARIAEQLGGLAETLRSIGTPELLHRMEVIRGELITLRQEIKQQHEAYHQEIRSVQEGLGAQVAGVKTLVTTVRNLVEYAKGLKEETAGVKTLVTTVRNLVLGCIGLSLITLGLLAWLVLTLGRG